MGCLGATWTQVFTHVRGVDVSFRDVKIKIPDRGMWMTSCTESERGGFGGIWKKSVSSELDSHGKSRLSGLAEARWICVLQAPHEMGGGADGKVIIERLCISLPYVETFNSKVIKGFVPELRSRYMFFVFRDFYVLCIYVMNILCTFHTYSYTGMLQAIGMVTWVQILDVTVCISRSTNTLREGKNPSIFLPNMGK